MVHCLSKTVTVIDSQLMLKAVEENLENC